MRDDTIKKKCKKDGLARRKFLQMSGTIAAGVTISPIMLGCESTDNSECEFWSPGKKGKSTATYVLVHGGGHGGWCYQFVAQILRKQGHDVYTPTMTGLGEREHLLSPEVDLDLQITDIVKVLEFEDLHEVILVGHSYGGMVITGVADRVTDRIANLVYLDAAYPQNGQSLVDHAGASILVTREASRVIDGIELVLFPGEDPLNFFGVTDPDLIAWMEPKLTPHPWKCFEQKLVLNNEEQMRQIPQSFIVCSFHMDDESRAALKALSDGRFWEIDTGHDLMITEPQQVADALTQLANV